MGGALAGTGFLPLATPGCTSGCSGHEIQIFKRQHVKLPGVTSTAWSWKAPRGAPRTCQQSRRNPVPLLQGVQKALVCHAASEDHLHAWQLA